MSERATVRKYLSGVAMASLLAVFVVGCSDDSTFADGTVPPDTDAKYLGYAVRDAKLTTCGNCHATFQAGWETTGHADAWEGLQGSGHAQSFCEGCHTTNQLGNPDVANAGWLAVKDSTYLDVQCESCHGSGWDHINSPGAVQPLCSIVADTAATTGCGECHSGEHHPFVEQWVQSRHGQLNSYPAGREGCNQCHEGRAALEFKFLETGNYVEKEDPDNLQPIVCAVCHDPHGSIYEANLRAPVATSTLDHLCVRCHAREGEPPNRRGPHAAQGLLVLNEDVGWIPPGFEDPGLHWHASPVLNPEVCITCHVNMFEVTDSAGEFVFQSVGHNFEAIPCLDEEGIPSGEAECEDEERDWTACEPCHDDPIGKYNDTWAAINVLLDELWVDSNANDTMDVADAGLLPSLVVASGDTLELDPSDQLITVAEGALWNAQLAFTSDREWWSGFNVFGVSVSAHPSSGNGVHSPEFLIAILEASIDAVIDRYSP
ncbi:MAG TPA: cytochrome c3 family protein [Gemmatimonadota bacterium]|nr:cytochrome c3 family protein [Gemmatimonadota bacterium]